MATITAGSGATLKSFTAEQQIIEAATLVWQAQSNSSQNPTAVNAVSWSLSSSGGTFAGTYSLPSTQVIQPGGGLLITADSWLTGVTFAAGSGGTYSASTPEAALLERLMLVQSLEQQVAKNPNGRNFVTGSFDSETRLYQGSFSLPVTVSINGSGQINYFATPYLVD